MEPIGPLDQLAMCCGLNRRSQRAGFDRAFHQQQRNYHYYSPSMAHMNALAASCQPPLAAAVPGGWTMGATSGPAFMQVPPQPYLLVTQPVILATPQQQQQQLQQQQQQQNQLQQRHPQPQPQVVELSTAHQIATASLLGGPTQKADQLQHQLPTTNTTTSLALIAQHANNAQLQSASTATAAAGLQMASRIPMSSQYAIYSSGIPVQSTSIYDSPRQLQLQQQALMNNQSIFLGSGMGQIRQQQQLQSRKPRGRALNSEIFTKLDLIDKQVDLTQEMFLVERHGIVITRAIDPYTLMPHLSADMLRQYQTQFLPGDEHVIRFIEIIKRPGQTLGLYIRTVQLESRNSAAFREGLVVTKIESDSPIYTSEVLQVGDEILSINLIDVQGMSLDDVVIIMSIPKRLVLALRIPKDRDQLLLGSSAAEGGRPFASGNAMIGNMGLSPRRLANEDALGGCDYLAVAGDLAVSPAVVTRNNAIIRSSSRLGEQEIVVQLAPPVRVQSAVQMNEILNEQDAELDGFDAEIANLRTESRLHTTGSGDVEEGSEQVRVRNLSRFDHELASLERDAMNREQSLRTAAIYEQQRQQQKRFIGSQMCPPLTSAPGQCPTVGGFTSQVEAANTRNSSSPSDLDTHGTPQRPAVGSSRGPTASATLPRRILPVPPEEQFDPSIGLLPSPLLAGPTSNPSTLTRRPIINNIRLGSTNEQSDYFSSSIDAINRELKELRRQRMALDTKEFMNCNSSENINNSTNTNTNHNTNTNNINGSSESSSTSADSAATQQRTSTNATSRTSRGTNSAPVREDY